MPAGSVSCLLGQGPNQYILQSVTPETTALPTGVDKATTSQEGYGQSNYFSGGTPLPHPAWSQWITDEHEADVSQSCIDLLRCTFFFLRTFPSCVGRPDGSNPPPSEDAPLGVQKKKKKSTKKSPKLPGDALADGLARDTGEGPRDADKAARDAVKASEGSDEGASGAKRGKGIKVRDLVRSSVFQASGFGKGGFRLLDSGRGARWRKSVTKARR